MACKASRCQWSDGCSRSRVNPEYLLLVRSGRYRVATFTVTKIPRSKKAPEPLDCALSDNTDELVCFQPRSIAGF